MDDLGTKPIFDAHPFIEDGSIKTIRDLRDKLREMVMVKSGEFTDDQIEERKFAIANLPMRPFMESYGLCGFDVNQMDFIRFSVIWAIMRGIIPEE